MDDSVGGASSSEPVFDRCCAPWLKDGSRAGGCGLDHPRVVLDWIIDKQDDDGDDNNDDKIVDKGHAVATLTHPLDPFLRYFDRLCDRGLAGRREKKIKQPEKDGAGAAGGLLVPVVTYSLVGFLQSHVDRLESQAQRAQAGGGGGFGKHLFKVQSRDAWAASRRAHERHAAREEEMVQQQANKRRKLQGPDATDLEPLLDQVLEVCCHHDSGLRAHLDVAEIAWMRLSGNRTMAQHAAQLATWRMQQLRLSCSVLLDGMVQIVRRRSELPDDQQQLREGCLRPLHAQDYEDRSGGGVLTDAFAFASTVCITTGRRTEVLLNSNSNNPTVHLYRVAAGRVPLMLSSSRSTNGDAKQPAATTEAAGSSAATAAAPTQGAFVFAPAGRPNADLCFESNWLCLQGEEGGVPSSNNNNNHNIENYRGHLVRVYLEAAVPPAAAAADESGTNKKKNNNNNNNKKLPEQDLLFSEPLEVARCSIVPARFIQGGGSLSPEVPTFPPVGVPTTANGITYEFSASEVEEMDSRREMPDGHHPGNDNNNAEPPDSSTTVGDGGAVRYRGRLRIREIRFGFADLLGVYVRKKLRVAKRHLQEIKAKRPATRVEKEYVRALARAAREAPGDAAAFDGMRGW